MFDDIAAIARHGLNSLREREKFIQTQLVKNARIPRKDFLALYPDNLTKVRWVDSLMKEKKYKKDLLEKVMTGDQVIVVAGKDKGKQGSVTKILSNGRCYVSGVQMVKRHTKPNPNAGIAGGVVEKESSIDMSNISIFNPSTKKADKVKIKSQEDGSKIRVFKSSGKEI